MSSKVIQAPFAWWHFVMQYRNDRFLDWCLLPKLVEIAGSWMQRLTPGTIDTHHLVNPLTTREWLNRF